MSETGMRVYELGYILVPTTPETEVPSKVDALKATVTELGGTVQSSGTPEFIDLAYRIEKDVASKKMKWSQGYFGWMKFEAAPEVLEAIKKALDGNTDLARHLLVKTDIENTVIFKKPKVEAKRSSGEEEEIPLEEEDVALEDDMQSDHEKLPDLEADIAEDVAEEKEEE